MTKPLEERDPEKAAKLIKAFTQDGATVQSVARETGMPYMTAKRFKQRNEGVIIDCGRTKWEHLVPELQAMAAEAVQQARDALPKASSKDAMIAAGIAVEKGLLIEGRPTHNVSVVHEHRHNLPGLLEALQKSLERRQSHLSVEGSVVDGEVDD